MPRKPKDSYFQANYPRTVNPSNVSEALPLPHTQRLVNVTSLFTSEVQAAVRPSDRAG